MAGHHGCSRPGGRRNHKVAGGPAERCTDSEGDRAVDQEEHRTERALRKGTVVQVAHRMETVVREGHHMVMARVVHRKETAPEVHHREKEQGVRRMATEQEAVHRKAIVREVVVLGGKEEHRIGLKVEGQRE